MTTKTSNQLSSSPLVSTHLESLHSLPQLLQLLLSLLDSLLESPLGLPQLPLFKKNKNSFFSPYYRWIDDGQKSHMTTEHL